MKVCVEWATDGYPIEDLGLPTEVNVPDNIGIDDIADWLSDKYGYLVETFFII